ncbi:hypothetical protein GCM10009504_21560 [Pseudomonas laurentiana]|uniref:Uncharacterized protein n=1 Tax=Pseudomonas laurentiana TaxID=2364649 RepID=A0A6I5RUS4_9PSED|nr:hypothetical protein [Pseudomonas laurentiana]NES11743.1 hypothetical protein [Pseudomonas laurentiana]GGU64225.1 hypothetical protein GCM10009504_21560 [Pseudomonas laurentiana]
MKNAAMTLCLFALPLAQASASSDTAWADAQRQALASCVEASQLTAVKPLKQSALFDDSVGYTAILLQGRYKPAHMKNKAGTELCLYHRETRTAHVTEWDAVRPVR